MRPWEVEHASSAETVARQKAAFWEVLATGAPATFVCLWHDRSGRIDLYSVDIHRVTPKPHVADMLGDVALAGVCRQHDERITSLSRREMQVLRCLSGGQAVRATAEQLNISESTIRTHLERIRDKLGLERLEQLIVYAAREAPGSLPPEIAPENGRKNRRP